MGGLLFFVTMLGSLFVVDYLARERGWNRSRWAVASSLIGPLAIPLIYLADAICAVRKMMSAARN